MLTFKKSLAGDMLARSYYLLGLRSHTELLVEHMQSQNLLSLCLTTAITQKAIVQSDGVNNMNSREISEQKNRQSKLLINYIYIDCFSVQI